MPELEVLEARIPVRSPQVGTKPGPAGRLAPLAAMLRGPVFTRAKDIMAANVADLVDRAEEPGRMIRMIILEMEQTLVEIRATAARAIADIKEMRRSAERLEQVQAGWKDKAELALSKGRDDLARLALAEWQKAAETGAGVVAEVEALERVLRGYEEYIAGLQARLREARARQAAIHARIDGAATRARTRELLYGNRTEAAFSRFELLERQADLAEARCEALGLGRRAGFEDGSGVRTAARVEAELEAMKAALAARPN